MKTTIALATLLLVTGVGFAQLVNADFEEWQGNNPVGWNAFNWPGVWESVQRSDQAFSGSYAARMIVSEEFPAALMNQVIAVTRIERSVSLGLQYAGLPEGTQGEITLAASLGGTIIDGDGLEFYGHNPDYQPATLVWEPAFENYDTLDVWLTLGPIDSAVVGELLLDHLVLTGVSGQGVPSEPASLVAEGWTLGEVYPNPFNSRTTVRFVSPAAASVDLAVYDLAGRRVATIANGIFTPGGHNVPWVAPEGLGAGAYIVRLNTGNRSFNTRAIFLK